MPDDPIALNLARILYRLMMDPRGWRVDSLKERLGIADRTYRKYRGLLQDHFEHLFDREGRSLIQEKVEGEGKYLCILDPEESAGHESDYVARAVALRLASDALGYLEGTDLGEGLDRLQKELMDTVGDRPYVFRNLIRNLDRVIYNVPFAPKDYSRKKKVIAALLQALLQTRRLQMTYQSPGAKPEDRLVEPLSLVQYQGGLYLFARFEARKRPYIFSVDRIKKASVTPDSFRYPDPAEYSPKRFTDGNFGIFHERDGKPTRVELVFADNPWLQTYLRERQWHPTQRFRELPDGRLRMTFTVRSMVQVEPWIRSFGGDVEKIHPAD